MLTGCAQVDVYTAVLSQHNHGQVVEDLFPLHVCQISILVDQLFYLVGGELLVFAKAARLNAGFGNTLLNEEQLCASDTAF